MTGDWVELTDIVTSPFIEIPPGDWDDSIPPYWVEGWDSEVLDAAGDRHACSNNGGYLVACSDYADLADYLIGLVEPAISCAGVVVNGVWVTIDIYSLDELSGFYDS